MRKKLIAGNWKMNLDWNEAMSLFTELIQIEKATTLEVDVAVLPPSLYLRHFFEMAKHSKSTIAIGAQDCSANVVGAYTGEVSAEMIASVGSQYCIVGHSERRAYHRESDQLLTDKVNRVLDAGLIPIFCCGERLEDRENENQTFVVDNQLDATIFSLEPDQFSKVVIAYEPVWAIGTGKTASPEQAQEMHAFIRGLVQSRYGQSIAEQCRILYGGSMKPSNAKELLSQPDVDGGLIGGASLKASDFFGIINS
ncbi:MAG: triose-phosphate isomerase [Salibacteraceae bacterium]